MNKLNKDDLSDLPTIDEVETYVPPFSLEILTMTAARGEGQAICTFTIRIGDALNITSCRLMEGNQGIWLALPKQRPAQPGKDWQRIIDMDDRLMEFLKDLAVERWDALQLISAFGTRTGRVKGKPKSKTLV